MLLLSLIIFIAAAAAYQYGYLPSRERASNNAKSGSKFRAVAIVCDDSVACPAARALDGKRFLCDKAPKLPLHGCTAESCTCVFHHHPDRRKGHRRVDDESGVFAPPYEGRNVRDQAGGRRFNDAEQTGELVVEKTGDGIDPDDTYYDFIAKVAKTL